MTYIHTYITQRHDTEIERYIHHIYIYYTSYTTHIQIHDIYHTLSYIYVPCYISNIKYAIYAHTHK